MNQRDANKLAWRLAASVVQSHLAAGWPFTMVGDRDAEVGGVLLEDEGGQPTLDGERLEQALNEVVAAMRRRGM